MDVYARASYAQAYAGSRQPSVPSVPARSTNLALQPWSQACTRVHCSAVGWLLHAKLIVVVRPARGLAGPSRTLRIAARNGAKRR